jgi:hypothetical protein
MAPLSGRGVSQVVAVRLVLGWVGCAVVFAVAVGGIAAGAQSWARADLARFASPGWAGPQTHSVGLHVLAMLALAALTAAAVAPFVASPRTWLPAACVLVGVAAGPMRVCAAPMSRSFLAPVVTWTGELNLSGGTRAEWRVSVAVVLVLVMAAAAVWTAVVLRRPPGAPRPMWTVFVLAAVVAFVAQALAHYGWSRPGGMTAVGWALLVGGLVAAVGASVRWWAGPAALAGVVVTLALMRAAYQYVPGNVNGPGLLESWEAYRGVAGWEYLGHAPAVLSREVVILLVAAPAVGFAAQIARQAMTGARAAGGELDRWDAVFGRAWKNPRKVGGLRCPACGSRALNLLYVLDELDAPRGMSAFWCGDCLTGLPPNPRSVPEGAERVVRGEERVPDYRVVTDR